MFRVLSFLSILLFFSGCENSADLSDGNMIPIVSTDGERQSNVALMDSIEADQYKGPLPTVSPNHTYTLPELIDIAQQRNPATRQAWQHLRTAGQQAKIVKSALLPFIAATVVGGSQHFKNTADIPLLGPLKVDNSAEGVVGVLTVNWLLFDFGENAARRRVAKNLEKISGYTFTRLHQQVVFDVALAYYSRIAALKKQKYSAQAADRAAQLVEAAKRRLEAGVGHKVEVAQAKQLQAQTKLNQRIANGEANTAAVSLAVSLSLPPTTKIHLRSDSSRLPRMGDRKMESLIKTAFTTRPDVLAALAQVRAAQNNVDAVSASYMPKIMLAGNLADGNAALNLNGISADNVSPTHGSGILIGATIPLFDGNLRKHRVQVSKNQLAAARNGVSIAKAAASREIALAYESLRTALAVNQAAEELVRAATTTADVAQKSYVNGAATISDTSLATLGLYAAKETLIDSQRAAHHAAITLALAVGGRSSK
jgi:outer membrane protein TolC